MKVINNEKGVLTACPYCGHNSFVVYYGAGKNHNQNLGGLGTPNNERWLTKHYFKDYSNYKTYSKAHMAWCADCKKRIGNAFRIVE